MIRLHNTLTDKLEELKPITPGVIKMFVCGPTVYDFAHLGNAKTYTQFDLLARFLEYRNLDVTYLQNITDIDDKIIKRATERNLTPEDLALEYEKYYLEDMASLNNRSVTKYARAQDYIPSIVSQVTRLVEKGLAYKISDGFYFDIKKFEDYGKLSGRTSLSNEDAVSRIDENVEKRNAGDFCLWKFKKENEPFWETELGEGRPGWHIEDTAITEQELGDQYDLHGGARDLIFPHHEAEIAQMEGISGKKPLVRHWVHTGFLTTNTEKMSKSLGNFATIRSTIESGIDPMALRYFFISGHYRSPLNFTPEAIQGAENAFKRLRTLIRLFKSESVGAGKINEQYKQEFVEALENDLNTPEALAVVWKLAKNAGDDISYGDAYVTLLDFDRVLGLKLETDESEIVNIPDEVQNLLQERELARLARNFSKSDEIRDKIEKAGFTIKDTGNGPTLEKI